MSDLQFAISLIKKHEGLQLKPYKDTEGILTIGYGRNLEDVGISMEEAELMLAKDTETAEREAKTIFPNYSSLSIGRKAVLVNMMFNLGKTRFLGFKKMIAAVNAGDFSTAAREMLDSKWATQVGKRAIELSKLMKGGSNVAS